MSRHHFSKSGYPGGVVQSAAVNSREWTRGGMSLLFEAVVINVHFVDDRDNLSASATGNTGGIGDGQALVASNTNGTLNPLYTYQTGYRVECDIYTLATSHKGGSYQYIRNVPVMQRGGLKDIDLWVPKGCTNFLKDLPLNPDRLDGDFVLCQCLGGVWPKGAIILGSSPHRSNFLDPPRSVKGSREFAKFPGDGSRKDGNIKLTRYNGAVSPFIDRHGNILFDTSEAGHIHIIDQQTGKVAVFQNSIPWYAAGDTVGSLTTVQETGILGVPAADVYPKGLGSGARYPFAVPSPGGGDVTFRVKDTRKFRVEFNDNAVVVDNITKKNPREFLETGYIQIHKDPVALPGTRTIEIASSDNLIINVRSADGSNSGTVTINCEKPLNGITLGGNELLLDNIATKSFVRDMFLNHLHQTGMGPTSPPVVGGLFVGPTVDDATGIVVTHPAIKVSTTKVRGE